MIAKMSDDNNTTSWNRWGLYPHTEDEIRTKFLEDPDNICMNFLTDYSVLSPDFIEEIKILSILDPRTEKPFINKDNYSFLYPELSKFYKNIWEGLNLYISPKARKTFVHVSDYISRIDYNKRKRLQITGRIKRLSIPTDPALADDDNEYQRLEKKRLETLKSSEHQLMLIKQRLPKSYEDLDAAKKFIEDGTFNRSGRFYRDLQNVFNDRIPEHKYSKTGDMSYEYNPML